MRDMDDLKRQAEIDAFQFEESTARHCTALCGLFLAGAFCLDVARYIGWL